MKLLIETEKQLWTAGETVIVRFLAINDSYESVEIDRRLLIGPNPVSRGEEGGPHPVSREPAFHGAGENLVTLNPWGIFGRERSFSNLPEGETIFHGYLVAAFTDALLPDRPAEEGMKYLTAAPALIKVGR